MSDRAIASLIMLLPTALCWWLASGYLRVGEIYSFRTGTSVTRAAHPTRFWAGVVLTVLPGCFTFGLFLLGAGLFGSRQ